MPAGLQVFGPDGAIWCDTSTRLARNYGNINMGPNTQTVSLAQLVGQGKMFALNPSTAGQTFSTGTSTFRAPVTATMFFNETNGDFTAQFQFANYVNPYVLCYYGAF